MSPRPRTRRPLIDRIVPKIDAPSALVIDPWWEDYPLLAPFAFDRVEHWLWTAACSNKGARGLRPVIQSAGVGSPIVHVFRIMLALKDRVPLSRRWGFHACHDETVCRNTKCVNPFHGYWGTRGRNHEDRERYAPETFKRKEAR